MAKSPVARTLFRPRAEICGPGARYNSTAFHTIDSPEILDSVPHPGGEKWGSGRAGEIRARPI
jgi:hypothetical protein